MDSSMDTYWWWWIATIAVIALELSTGTVYLLMVALGIAAGGLAAWLAQSFEVQMLVAAALATVGCIIVHRLRARLPASLESQRNANVHIDLGNLVTVTAWQADGSAQVQYRGAAWAARLDTGQPPATTGLHSIVAMQGNTLVLKPI